MVQLTLIQIDNYGPWTVDPKPRPETDIQSLQASLYADLCGLFGGHLSLLFYSRFDNMLAVTNGMTESDHSLIQESISNRYPVTVSMGIGSSDKPSTAVQKATNALHSAGSAQDSTRKEELVINNLESNSEIQVAHFDANDATNLFTDELDAFEAMIRIESAYYELMQYLWTQHDSLSFFVGGDNIISVTPGLDMGVYSQVVEHILNEVGVELKVGVGSSQIPRDAGVRAKLGLERCRETGDTVVNYD